MNESCRNFRDLIVADTLHELAAEDRDALEHHLRTCAGCRDLRLAMQEDDRRLSAFVSATDGVIARLEDKIVENVSAVRPTPTHRAAPRRRFFTPLRFAAAATLVAIIVLAVNVLDQGPGGSVVWADVLTRVEEAQDFICRRIEKRSGEPALEIVEYRSSTYGLRQDIYEKDKLQATQYIVPAEKMLYAFIHRDRTYMQQRLSDEMITELRRQTNASEIVKSFKDREYENLGRRRIDGRMAEGIEIRNPKDWVAIFESGTFRLWVDLETQWPVRIELEGVASGGKVRKTYVLKDFEWNARLSAGDFAAEVPPGYKLIADLAPVEANEENTILALGEYAKLVGGRYPSTLSFATAIAEAERHLDARHDSHDKAAGEDLTSLFKIRNACDFYGDLLNSDKDVAYYGDKVSPRDFDRVLLRWRLDDGQYRVIYGDLRSETASASRLAELETGD